MFPMRLDSCWVNQRLPSEPTAIPYGPKLLVEGMAYSVTAWVVGLIRPTFSASSSVNQTFPSGPETIEKGPEDAVWTGYSAIAETPDSRQRSSSPSIRKARRPG